MIQPSRSRHGPVCRKVAVWLIAAQMILFSATGLTHSHAIPAGTGLTSAASCGLHASSTRAAVQQPGGSHRGGGADCAICQMARSSVASIATAHGAVASITLCGHPAVDLPVFLPVPPIGPCSTRAPPSA